MERSLFSISLKNEKKFTQLEIDELQHEITGFLSLFVSEYLMPPLTTNDTIFEITFEHNSKVKSLVENFLIETKNYDKQYDLVFTADKVS